MFDKIPRWWRKLNEETQDDFIRWSVIVFSILLLLAAGASKCN